MSGDVLSQICFRERWHVLAGKEADLDDKAVPRQRRRRKSLNV